MEPTLFYTYIAQGKDYGSISFTIHDISKRHRTLFSWLDVSLNKNYHLYTQCDIGLFRYMGVGKVTGINFGYMESGHAIDIVTGSFKPLRYSGCLLENLVFAEVAYTDLLYIAWFEIDIVVKKIQQKVKWKLLHLKYKHYTLKRAYIIRRFGVWKYKKNYWKKRNGNPFSS